MQKSLLSSINKYRPQIMGFAALWILVYHEWQLLSPAWSAPYYAERFIKDIGFIGVDMFLLLSGMGLSYAVRRHPLKEFYRRRFSRLVLPVLAAGVLRVPISRWTLGYFARCLSGYSFLTGNVTAFIWYVYAIAIFYLFFPLYWYFFSKSGNKYFFFAAALAVWAAAVFLLKNSLSDTAWLVMNRVPVFLLGTLFGWMEQNGKAANVKTPPAVIGSLIALVVGLALEFVCSVYGTKLLVPMPTVFLPALMVGVSAVLLLAAAFERRGSGGKVLGFFGGLSLELYCLQEVLGDYFIPLLGGLFPPLAVNIVFLLIVTAAAWLLHWLNEKIVGLI